MSRNCCVGAAFATALFVVSFAGARPVTITFENDALGPRPNGFSSVDSSLVTFTNTFDSGLLIGDFGIASIGRALAVGDNDNSMLLLNFSVPVNSLSMDFGNDNPAFTLPGDSVFLTAFLNNVQVGQVFVNMNRNTAMDQNISIGGIVFDSATVAYYVSSNGLTKVVDNITFNPIPGPEALGVLAAAAVTGRRRRRA